MVLPIAHPPKVLPGQLDTVHQASSDTRGLGKGMRLASGVLQLLPRLLQPRRMPGLLALQQGLDAGFRVLQPRHQALDAGRVLLGTPGGLLGHQALHTGRLLRAEAVTLRALLVLVLSLLTGLDLPLPRVLLRLPLLALLLGGLLPC